jgi:hypothetical protein
MSERNHAATWIGTYALVLAAQTANAQAAASARGRVLADSSEVPIFLECAVLVIWTK